MPRKKDRSPRFVRARLLREGETPLVGPPDLSLGNDDGPGAVLMLEIIGRVLSLLRRRYRLSQREMANRLDWPQSVVSTVENGEVNLTVEQLDDWATVIDVVASRVRGGAFEGVTPASLMEIGDAIAEALDEEGYDVVWGTGRLYEGPPSLVRGAELEELVLEHWPDEQRGVL